MNGNMLSIFGGHLAKKIVGQQMFRVKIVWVKTFGVSVKFWGLWFRNMNITGNGHNRRLPKEKIKITEDELHRK